MERQTKKTHQENLKLKAQVVQVRTKNKTEKVLQKQKARELKIKERQYYHCEKIVGQGAFGVVYKAKCLDTDEIVAVKKVLQDKQYKNRELEILRDLIHPNIINLKHFFYTSSDSDASSTYLNLVTDYYPETLTRIMNYFSKQKKSVPILLIKIYSFQLLRAIAYLHYHQIAHRDVKPQNLLIEPDDQSLVLCDFGSAKQIINEKELSVPYISTRYYRAPELLLGNEHYGVEIDLWAAGCVIAEMLRGGKILYPGDSNPDQLVKIIQMLGTPSEAQVSILNPKYPYKSMIKIKPQPINKYFASSVSQEGIDLVLGLLTYEPSKRITAIDALAHPFFDEVRDFQTRLSDGSNLPNLFDFTDEELQMASGILIEKILPSWKQTQRTSRRLRQK